MRKKLQLMLISFCILFEYQVFSFCCKVKYQFIDENFSLFFDEVTQFISGCFCFLASVHADIKWIMCLDQKFTFATISFIFGFLNNTVQNVKSVPASDIDLAFHFRLHAEL